MNVEAILDLIRALVLIFILLYSFFFIGYQKFTVCLTFFSLALLCILFSDLYWLAYDIIRPDKRMPFAANEIGEWALFLLLGSLLNYGKTLHLLEAKLESVCAVLFATANVVLWIAWSGEWVQDILTGLAFAYLLCALVLRIKTERFLFISHYKMVGVCCFILIVGQAGTFFVSDELYKTLDYICYTFLFAVTICLLIRTIRVIIKDDTPTQGICDSFILFAWVVVTMYMSEGIFYTLAYALSGVCFTLMFLALKKEVDVA